MHFPGSATLPFQKLQASACTGTDLPAIPVRTVLPIGLPAIPVSTILPTTLPILPDIAISLIGALSAVAIAVTLVLVQVHAALHEIPICILQHVIPFAGCVEACHDFAKSWQLVQHPKLRKLPELVGSLTCVAKTMQALEGPGMMPELWTGNQELEWQIGT